MGTVNTPVPASTAPATKLYSPQNTRLRQHGVQTIAPGGSNTMNLLTGFLVRHLFVRLQFSITGLTAAPTAANLVGADGWSLLQNVTITINGSQQIRNLPGRVLYWLQVLTGKNPPAQGWTFTSTSASFDGTLIIPFSWPDLIHPIDSCLDARQIPANAFTVQTNIGTVASVATGLTGTPVLSNATLTWSASESYPSANGFTPPLAIMLPTFNIPGTTGGAVSKQQLQLPSAIANLSYKGFLVNVQTVAGVDAPGVLTRWRTLSGVTALQDIDATSYQKQYLQERGNFPQYYANANPVQATSATADNINGWYLFDFAADGYATEALSMNGVGSFFCNVDTSAASSINVYPIAIYAAS